MTERDRQQRERFVRINFAAARATLEDLNADSTPARGAKTRSPSRKSAGAQKIYRADCVLLGAWKSAGHLLEVKRVRPQTP